MSSTKRVVKNTFFLYVKMAITIVIALYSTRIVLKSLGVNDFGIYSLVGGVISMLAFLNSAMIISSQRYISYYLGTGQVDKSLLIFKTSKRLHLIIGLGIVLVLEIIQPFLFNGFLNIPAERIYAAKVVYQMMVFSTFFTINAVPYDAIINAHEDMLFDSIVGVAESFIKLLIAFSLSLFGKDSDSLMIYVGGLTVLVVIIRLVKSIFCVLNYEECHLGKKIKYDISLMREMFSFAFWSSFGILSSIGRVQGIAVVLNIFFGAAVNAAYAIANQINGQIYAFSSNMLKALEPQIVKNEGAGNREKMVNLSLKASRYGFFLLAFFAIPMIILMPLVLKLWLGNIPDHTIIFCRLILLIFLLKQLTIGAYAAIQSTGKIKYYQISTGVIYLMNVPISWVVLKMGYPPHVAILCMLFIEFIVMFVSMYYWKMICGVQYSDMYKSVIIRILVPTVVGISISLLLRTFIPDSSMLLNLMVFIPIWFLLYAILIFYLGIERNEKRIIIDKLLILKYRFKNKLND